MVRAGLFEFGTDPQADLAYSLNSGLDQFLTEPSNGIEVAFDYLKGLLAPALQSQVPAPQDPPEDLKIA